MKTAYNFNAGPCVLPKEAIESTIAAIRDFDNTGIGLLEISHRTPGWERTMEETRQLWRDLLGIPAEYEILFLGGGASTGFMDVPANLLNKKAAYLQTGVWAKKAAKEAKNFGETVIVASSEDKTYSYIPKGWTVPADADYFHITTNNTIYGTEIRKDFAANEINNVMLVADMSSDIMSRPVDVKKYGLIYGGAQKNVGPAGVTFYIVRKDILGKITDRQYMNPLPTMVDFRTHAAEEAKNISMFNTPPVSAIFVMHETLKWVKNTIGGDRPQQHVPRHRREGRPLDHEPLLGHGRGPREPAGRLHGLRQGARHGRHQGSPLGGRLPRQPLQRLPRRGRRGSRPVHAGLRESQQVRV